jgi:RNA polymerase sigma-70 factor (ECF subfamily)
MGDDLRPTLERARKGDREAFGQLVRSYHRRVYMTAYRMMGNHDDANDVVQDAFVRAMRGLPSFDGRSDFFTWLYRIVINVALNHLRQRKRRRAVSLEQVVLPERLQREVDGDPKRKLELKRMAVEIGQAIADLPDTLQATLVLVVLEGVSYRDAAEILECSEGTVAWRVHEARQRLLGRLGKYLGRRSASTGNEDELRGDTTEAVDGSR